jgi:hypothetical protein
MIKWNWGTGIFIFIVFFMAACIAFLIYTHNQDWSLVEEDYYPKELRHEEKLVKMRNVSALTGQFRIAMEPSGLIIGFPADFRGSAMTGTVQIYRPSDEKLDIVLPVVLDSSLSMSIPASRLFHGKYVVKADWSANGKEYYLEKEVFVP